MPTFLPTSRCPDVTEPPPDRLSLWALRGRFSLRRKRAPRQPEVGEATRGSGLGPSGPQSKTSRVVLSVGRPPGAACVVDGIDRYRGSGRAVAVVRLPGRRHAPRVASKVTTLSEQVVQHDQPARARGRANARAASPHPGDAAATTAEGVDRAGEVIRERTTAAPLGRLHRLNARPGAPQCDRDWVASCSRRALTTGQSSSVRASAHALISLRSQSLARRAPG